MARNKVNWEDFVAAYMKVYEAGGSNKDLAEMLDTTPSAVIGRTSFARKAGVQLPTMKTRGNTINKLSAEKMNGIIAKTVSKKVAGTPLKQAP